MRIWSYTNIKKCPPKLVSLNIHTDKYTYSSNRGCHFLNCLHMSRDLSESSILNILELVTGPTYIFIEIEWDYQF